MLSSDNLDIKRKWSEFWHQVEQNSQPEHCILCGKKISSPCNSHVVPQFILRRIAENGMVCYGQSLNYNSQKNDILKTVTGINNAFTFRLICNDCDRLRFCHYESPEAIVNYESLSLEEQKTILSEMAIKTHLSHLYTKAKIYTMNAAQYPELIDEFHERGMKTAYELDIEEHLEYIQTLTKFRKATSFPFKVLYDRLLDYETGIATQTIIAFTFDLKGKSQFDPYDFSQTYLMHYLYLMILPCQGKTRVLFYVEKKYQPRVQSIIDDFEQLTEEEKLHFLFVSLIIYDEQFYITPSLKRRMEEDSKIITLYTQTDGYPVNTAREIVHFREYQNYLIDES